MAHTLGKPTWGGRGLHLPLLFNSQALLLACLPIWWCFACSYSFPIQRGFINCLCTQFRDWGGGQSRLCPIGVLILPS